MTRIFTVFCLLVVASTIVADPVTKPHNFAGGDPISASQMNANFDILYAVLNGNIDGSNFKSNVGIGANNPAGLFQVQSQTSVGAGQLSSSGTNVAGFSGTAFTTELAIGDEIIAAGQSRVITSIVSDNSLVTDSAFNPVLSFENFQYSSPLLVVDGTGNLGIGRATPSTALDVAGSIRSTGFQLGTSTTAGYILTADSSGVGTWQAASGGGSQWTENGGNVYRSSGNVGIGTTAPTVRLDVAGKIAVVYNDFYGGVLSLHNTAGGGLNNIHFKDTAGIIRGSFGYDNSTDNLIIGDSSLGYVVNVAQGGNVGIGTTSPSQKLDVAGTIKSTGFQLGTTVVPTTLSDHMIQNCLSGTA